jgi:hypothetical protein
VLVSHFCSSSLVSIFSFFCVPIFFLPFCHLSLFPFYLRVSA